MLAPLKRTYASFIPPIALLGIDGRPEGSPRTSQEEDASFQELQSGLVPDRPHGCCKHASDDDLQQALPETHVLI
jgi:hypothetical protein